MPGEVPAVGRRFEPMRRSVSCVELRQHRTPQRSEDHPPFHAPRTGRFLSFATQDFPAPLLLRYL
jgi:hypothetical protein